MPFSHNSDAGRGDIHFAEFVALMALMMALTALSIDIMLVALPDIAGTYAVASPNDRQYVITAYMVGLALGQPIFGPLSDRFGRKSLLTAGLLIFAAGALGAVVAPSFGLLLAARVLQGLGAASPRVVATAIVRDRFAGPDMARVMSFVITVLIIVPVIAPAIGAGILLVGPWPLVFGFLFLVAMAALAWSALRLPETLPRANRIPLSGRSLARALAHVVTTRQTLGYAVALGFTFAVIMSYVTSAQQVFVDVYGLRSLFPVVFGSVALAIAAASLLNSRLVGRFGMRRISRLALIGFVAVSAAMALAGFPEKPPLLLFCAYLAASLFAFGLMMPNFNALAMEPMGLVAGMASSFIGFYSTAAGALLGALVAQLFDGTVRPLLMGFTALGILTFVTVWITEGGRVKNSAEGTGRRKG